MRLSFQLFSIGAVLSAGILFMTGCAKEEGIKPLDNVSIEERGTLVNTSPSIALIGLTPDNELVHLLSGPPVSEKSIVPIAGLRVDERIIAIDMRVKTRQLLGFSNQNVLYRIDPITGVATAINLTPFDPPVSGEMVGFDVNPVDDLVRIVTDQGQNLRVSPVTGAVVGVDGLLNPGTPAVNSIAYSAPTLTSPSFLYSIDLSTQSLNFVHPPSDGSMKTIGSLGFTFSAEGGFEITNKNIAFAIQYGFGRVPANAGSNASHDDVTVEAYRLLGINLRSGQATSLGQVRPMIGLASR